MSQRKSRCGVSLPNQIWNWSIPSVNRNLRILEIHVLLVKLRSLAEFLLEALTLPRNAVSDSATYPPYLLTARRCRIFSCSLFFPERTPHGPAGIPVSARSPHREVRSALPSVLSSVVARKTNLR